jgi:hypothetical protein
VRKCSGGAGDELCRGCCLRVLERSVRSQRRQQQDSSKTADSRHIHSVAQVDDEPGDRRAEAESRITGESWSGGRGEVK